MVSDCSHAGIRIDGNCPHQFTWAFSGTAQLLDTQSPKYAPLAKLRPFDEKHPDTLAHPAISGGRLYLRSAKVLGCFGLAE